MPLHVDESRVRGFSKSNMVRKLSDSYTAADMSKTIEEGIVGVNGTSNQAVVQRFSRASPGIDLNF